MNKRTFVSLSLGLALSWSALPVSGQKLGLVEEQEQAARYLATVMATESGGQPDQYLTYCRELAIALVILSPEEQSEVVGFKPPIPNSVSLEKFPKLKKAKARLEGSEKDTESDP